ncbi:MAG: BLUF domain-containing protein [Alphaproteobacteria bacterium]
MPGNGLIQVIYASAAVEKFSPEALHELLAKSRRHNGAQGITGLLVYHEGSFLQVLEGPSAAVDRLIEIIKGDSRHHRFQLLWRDLVPEREFGGWSMGFVDTTNSTSDLLGFLDYRSELDAATSDGSRAASVLKRFRDGQWRHYVEGR